ncbi:MAG: hypothetical protein Q7U53_10425 [Anaerolineaceae bacterium]|nr:hypothetical protein [Anaerolineaceae bacterium]
MKLSSGFVVNIPNETAQAAHQLFSNNNRYLQIGDCLESIVNQIDLALLDPSSIADKEFVFRLALTSAFQYAELLPDSLASLATMKRIDWKYALYLPTNHPGINKTALCKFRQLLYTSEKALSEFRHLLRILTEFGIFSHLKDQSLNPKDIISVICQINRLSRLQEALKVGISLVSAVAPDWLASNVASHWFARYRTGQMDLIDPCDYYNLKYFAEKTGTDIFLFLQVLHKKDSPDLLNRSEIQYLSQLFKQQYLQDGEILRWKDSGCINCIRNI